MDESPIEKAALSTDEIKKLLARAQGGDLTCLPELRALLEDKPELWKNVGNLADHAELTLLSLIGGKDLLARESIRLNHRDLKANLSNPNETPLEKLLVQRIAVSYLQVYHADLDAAAAASNGDGPRSVYAQRRLDSAQKRHLHAIKQLTMVRKLLTTAPNAKQATSGSGPSVDSGSINSPVKRPRGRPRKNSTEPSQETNSPAAT
jgi:hypothetical protein